MSGRILTAERLAESIKDLFAVFPKSKLGFTNREISESIWEDPTIWEEGIIRELLISARHIMEDRNKNSFMPLTAFYFQVFDDDHQPRTAEDARRCIAGYGRGSRTAGIRRILARHSGSNDRLSNLWIERLKVTSINAAKRFGTRVLIACNNGAMSKERAAEHLREATLLILPDDRKTIRKVLPRGIQVDGINIKLNGKGKSLKDLRVSK